MSLAINAAPFESNDSNKNYKIKINNTKISSVLNKIHDNNDDNSLGDFEPLPQALSAGVEKTKSKEGFQSNDTPEYFKVYEDSINELNERSNIPYLQPDIDFINTIPSFNSTSTNNVLEKKINKIISLLEQQQDYRTNNVTEEVILYSFFGIFIIYVIDSFKNIGKYTR